VQRTPPRGSVLLREDERHSKAHRRADDEPQDPSRLHAKAYGSRKTSVTRELPVGDAGHAPSAFAHPLIGGVRTTLLFTMSNAGQSGRTKSENRSQPVEPSRRLF